MLVATPSFRCDESGVFEDRQMLGDCLAGGAESMLHGQAGADLEQRLAVPVDELVKDGSTCRVVERLVQLGGHNSNIGKSTLACQHRRRAGGRIMVGMGVRDVVMLIAVVVAPASACGLETEGRFAGQLRRTGETPYWRCVR